MRFLLISNLITYFVTLMTVPLPIYGFTESYMTVTLVNLLYILNQRQGFNLMNTAI